MALHAEAGSLCLLATLVGVPFGWRLDAIHTQIDQPAAVFLAVSLQSSGIFCFPEREIYVYLTIDLRVRADKKKAGFSPRLSPNGKMAQRP